MSVDKRLVVAVLAVVAVLGVFWTQLIAPKRAESARIAERIEQAEARRDAAVRAASTAQAARRAYARDLATVTRLGKAVPQDDDVASLVYQLESVARRNRIDFRAVKLATDGAAAAAPAAGAEKSSSADGAGKQEAATASPSPAAPAVSQAPPGAVVGTAGLLTLPFSFTFDGGYMPMQRMLGAIDRLADAADGVVSVRGRLVTVDGFSLTPSRLGFPKVKAQVSATAYIAAPADAATGAATPGTPADPAKPGAAAGGAGATTTAAIQGVGR